jgi:hypothetical protein
MFYDPLLYVSFKNLHFETEKSDKNPFRLANISIEAPRIWILWIRIEVKSQNRIRIGMRILIRIQNPGARKLTKINKKPEFSLSERLLFLRMYGMFYGLLPTPSNL